MNLFFVFIMSENKKLVCPLCQNTDFEKQEGIAFLLVHFSKFNKSYFLPFSSLKKYITLASEGGRKSIPYIEFKKYNEVTTGCGYHLHYLEALNKHLLSIP